MVHCALLWNLPLGMRREIVQGDEINDHTWNALIRIAITYQDRLGKYRNQRYDRMAVYLVDNVREVASILVDDGIIQPWSAGFRRLSTIEGRVKADFLRIHGKYHTDP